MSREREVAPKIDMLIQGNKPSKYIRRSSAVHRWTINIYVRLLQANSKVNLYTVRI